ncbi:MAG: transglutaminaseTgpA domain-containing protein [Dictyoglomus sp.]|nr:transglutaminaseTgpA domain-containing protein [Dictyoglomus sp.]MCX7941537.1 transglutaminaseTgpA domain-containing protein [Dictyoglomaceae bacterium]MDW8187843.1 transglutaminaseTgpA domain-containing protein [Dictyoglomus sp.]
MSRMKKINIEIENSKILRGSIFYLNLIAIFSVWYFLNLSIDYILGVIFITFVGYIYSYKNRYNTSIILKIIMTLFMLYLLRDFFKNLLSQPYDPRIPLATFLINLNALHSFDLPTKLDLSFSFFISLILVVISGVFARESIFLFFLLFYMIGLIISLSLLNNYRPSSKYLSGTILSIAFIGFLLFPIIPRSLPFTFRQDIMSQVIQRITALRGEIRTPNVQVTNYYLYRLPEGRRFEPLPYDPENYFGFAPFVDLRQRGVPSSSLVFRVLTSFPTYHRGLAFDTYNGFGWYQSLEEEVDTITTDFQPFQITENPLPEERLFRSTYFIEKDTGNIIFIPQGTQRLYFPAPFIYKDAEGGVRSPFEIPKNLIYTSFYSDTSIRSAKILLKAKIPDKTKFNRYLQLPNISPKIKTLVLDITKNYKTPWEKILAIEKFLEENYPYSLDIPPLKDNVDAVEDFLFITKKGYCEQFATAFAIMSRIIGIPSRFITGFSPGELNPWTGMYEVRMKNAHAWVEIYLEPIGWIPIDPTPFGTIIEEVRVKENYNILGLIFNSLAQLLNNLFYFLYNLSTFYLFVIFIFLLALLIYILVRIIRRYQLTKEDRIFLNVMNMLKRKNLLDSGNSPYEMVRKLGDEIKEFVSVYYALKFAPLKEEERKRYREKLIKKGKEILKAKSFDLFLADGQGLNKD